MKLKFFGKPNSLVSVRAKNRLSKGPKKKPLFRFDDSGEYIMESENPRLIEAMKRKFVYQILAEDHEVLESAPEIKEEVAKLKHCKKCDFSCENMGDLLSHYREKHPKEKEE